jgi:hypothetical protein
MLLVIMKVVFKEYIMEYKFDYELNIKGKVTIKANSEQEANMIFNTMSFDELVNKNTK